VEPLSSEATRVRAALALLASHERGLRGTARRISICADDADDAYQRAVEILLTKAPPIEPPALIGWMHVVTRREALAVRRARERLLGPAAIVRGEPDPEAGRVEHLACKRPGPDELAEQRERVERARSALAELKSHERVALALQAGGYSYAEICGACGWTYTKTNRCLAEGRARLRRLGAME
jgi:RNA polymerase sigma factor (sigma-70 family)